MICTYFLFQRPRKGHAWGAGQHGRRPVWHV